MQKGKWDSFSREQLINIFNKAKTYKDITIALGYKACNGQLSQKIRDLGEELDFNMDKFNRGHQGKFEDLTGKIINDNLLVIGKIDNMSPTTWKCKCLNCGKELNITNSNINRQKSCGCLVQRGDNIEDLTNKTFGNFTVINFNKQKSKQEQRTYWDCRCNLCGKIKTYEAYMLKNAIPNSCGCISLTSKGENKITQILKENNITFKKEYSFEDFYSYKGHPYRFDFAIFNDTLQCLIEYHGIQHYNSNYNFGHEERFEDIHKRDVLKEQYCKNNNIPLIVIPYSDYEKIDTEYLLNKINGVKENA